MPTYEYACRSCGHHLEVSQTFSEEPLTTCPNCGGDLRKVFGSIGIVLKGSGFYRTDSRASNGKTASKDKEKKDSASSGSGGESPASGSGNSTSASSPTTSPSSSTSSDSGSSSKAAAAG